VSTFVSFERLRALRHLAHLVVSVGVLRTGSALVAIHRGIVRVSTPSSSHLGAVESMGHGAIDGAVVHWATHLAIHLAIYLAMHLAVHVIFVHGSIQVLIQGSGKRAIVYSSYGYLRAEPWGLVFFTHAVDIRPEALFKPAYLSKDLFAPHHFLFTVGCGGDVGELIDKGTCCINKLGEGGRCPIRYEGLMKSDNV
jgi:hypothetical protein